MPTPHRSLRALALLVCVLTGCAAARSDAPAAAPSAVTAPDVSSGNPALLAKDPPPGAETPAAGAPALDRKIIRDGDLTIEVQKAKQIPLVLKNVHETAGTLGGYVASETSHSIVIKVPTASLDATLGALAAFGHITRKDIRSRDVTSDYVDLEIRVANARHLRDRLAELLKQTQDVQRLLEIEKELARVTEEIERFEGQLRLMSNQTTFATLSIEVEESVSPGPVGWIFVGLYKGVKWLFVWD